MDFIWFLGQANNRIVILLKDSHLYVQVEEFYVYIVLNEWEEMILIMCLFWFALIIQGDPREPDMFWMGSTQ